jgi:hypothetical protein
MYPLGLVLRKYLVILMIANLVKIWEWVKEVVLVDEWKHLISLLEFQEVFILKISGMNVFNL